MSQQTRALLSVRGLNVKFGTQVGTVDAVTDVSYNLYPGETLGFVGESGAGKSVTGASLLRLIESPGQIVDGEIIFNGSDICSLDIQALRNLRGNDIALIPQDPLTALNPSYRIGTQITDVMKIHLDLTAQQRRNRAIKLLDEVGIPDPKSRIDDFPHQFSGGMRQRALIAMSLSCEPDILIADEPTTALDVTTQAQILDLLKELKERYNLTVQLITHDMGVVAEMCDRVAVMYAGKIVEKGPVERIFSEPRHPYTLGLMKSIPRLKDPRERLEAIPGMMPDLIETPSGCSFRDRCPYEKPQCATDEPLLETTDGTDHRSACFRHGEINFHDGLKIKDDNKPSERVIGDEIIQIEGLKKRFRPESESWVDRLLGERSFVHAVDDVSLNIHEGETLGLVGESGCGKTTLGRTITQLYDPDGGTIVYAGNNVTDFDSGELQAWRSDVQYIFQDPFSSLNPRKTVKQIIGRPLEIHDLVDTREERDARIVELLEAVGLDESHTTRYAHEFSGGQKQRIGIARALAVEPNFIVADEPTSALDVSVQASILNLLMDLQDRYDLSYLFISHNLNVVQHVADRIAVMYLGEIIETGTVEEIFSPPHHPYTEMLLSSVPQPNPGADESRIKPRGEPPSPINPPSGCRFHPRCPYAMPECSKAVPESIELSRNHAINCHLFDSAIMGKKDEDVEQIMRSGDNPERNPKEFKSE